VKATGAIIALSLQKSGTRRVPGQNGMFAPRFLGAYTRGKDPSCLGGVNAYNRYWNVKTSCSLLQREMMAVAVVTSLKTCEDPAYNHH